MILYLLIAALLLNIYCLLFKDVFIYRIRRVNKVWYIYINVCAVNGRVLKVVWKGRAFFRTVLHGLLYGRRMASRIKRLKRRRASCQMEEFILFFGSNTER